MLAARRGLVCRDGSIIRRRLINCNRRSLIFLVQGLRARLLYIHPAMHFLYRLRRDGQPLTYREVADKYKPQGELFFGTHGHPGRIARILAGEGRLHAQLNKAEVLRISNGCVLLQGEEGGHPQTWLCAQDEEAGGKALRKLRPPTGADLALSVFDDELP